MTPGLVLILAVAVLSGAYIGEWVSAHRAGNRRVAVAARDGLVVHLVFSSVFLIVAGLAP